MTALNELQVSVIMTGISGHVIKHINIYQLCLPPIKIDLFQKLRL